MSGMVHGEQPLIDSLLPDRLAWQPPESSPLKLRYLKWGNRFYGKRPAPVQATPVWWYLVVRAGNPQLVVGRQVIPLQARDVVIVHPSCPRGIRDERNRVSNVLGWQWADAPRCDDCAPTVRGHLRWRLGAEDLRRIERIHAACREEAFHADDYTPLAFEQLRIALDVALARSQNPVRGHSATRKPIDHAIEWMEHHLNHTNPVHHLCDYLQISASTLRRLFLRHKGLSPAAFYQRLKMNEARRLVRDRSVKEVAYTLGYHHPGDFSKAYKEFFGTSPTRQRGTK